jgi:hypothetical protein
MATRRQEVLEDCRYELSVNFQKPAIAILMFHGARIGLTYEEMGQLIDAGYLEDIPTHPNLSCGLPSPPWPNPRPEPKNPGPDPKREG